MSNKVIYVHFGTEANSTSEILCKNIRYSGIITLRLIKIFILLDTFVF